MNILKFIVPEYVLLLYVFRVFRVEHDRENPLDNARRYCHNGPDGLGRVITSDANFFSKILFQTVFFFFFRTDDQISHPVIIVKSCLRSMSDDRSNTLFQHGGISINRLNNKKKMSKKKNWTVYNRCTRTKLPVIFDKKNQKNKAPLV